MTKETLEFPMELGRAFITDFERGLGSTQPLVYDQHPRFM
jgi:hypothetical protein